VLTLTDQEMNALLFEDDDNYIISEEIIEDEVMIGNNIESIANNLLYLGLQTMETKGYLFVIIIYIYVTFLFYYLL
jgi:hypothetical protein